jgi:hypothetical protein
VKMVRLCGPHGKECTAGTGATTELAFLLRELRRNARLARSGQDSSIAAESADKAVQPSVPEDSLQSGAHSAALSVDELGRTSFATGEVSAAGSAVSPVLPALPRSAGRESGPANSSAERRRTTGGTGNTAELVRAFHEKARASLLDFS